MEGGFSKALLMKKANGKEMVAKIPCRNAGPPSLTTASEVAVLKYVREHTSVPVPRVLAWDSDSRNSVGAEYIIMEKAAGVPLFQQWGKMTEFDKLQLIKNLTKLECQLSSIPFPAYGGLYLRSSSTSLLSKHHLLSSQSIDPSNSYCVASSCDRSFMLEAGAAESGDSDVDGDRGPWTSISEFGIAIAKREMWRIANRPRKKNQGLFHHGTPEEQIDLLKSTVRLMRELDAHPILCQSSSSSRPILWHTDLHMGNIFVSPDENSRIVSLIDWQSISVFPAFLQARWPVFLKPPQEYVKGLVQPKLPDDFDQLDEGNKEIALYEWGQAKLAKAYEVSSYLEDRAAHHAMMNVPRVFRELFTRCGDTSETGVIPLRSCLIEIFQNWSTLGFSGECPYSFSEEEIRAHESQFNEYQTWHQVRELAMECLDTDAEGWIHPELDFVEKRRQNQELLAMFIEQMSSEMSPEEASRMWPFTDGI